MNDRDLEKLAHDYAAKAEQLLQQNGQPYTEDDIVKVAEFLIDNEYPQEDPVKELEQIKVAAFYDELEKLAEANPDSGLSELLKKKENEKIANAAAAAAELGLLAKADKWITRAGRRILNPTNRGVEDLNYVNNIGAQGKLTGPAAHEDFARRHARKAGYGALALGGLGTSYGGYRILKD